MSSSFGDLKTFLSHRAALVEYATPIVGDRSQAEEVVQEAYLRFAQTTDGRAAGIEQPIAYLYRIVRNLALDWSRRRVLEQRQRDAGPLWWELPEAPRTPEQELHYNEELDRLARALDRLPRRTRIAVEMHRFGGYTLKEIGARLGISQATAHRLVRDAMLDLANELTRERMD